MDEREDFVVFQSLATVEEAQFDDESASDDFATEFGIPVSETQAGKGATRTVARKPAVIPPRKAMPKSSRKPLWRAPEPLHRWMSDQPSLVAKRARLCRPVAIDMISMNARMAPAKELSVSAPTASPRVAPAKRRGRPKPPALSMDRVIHAGAAESPLKNGPNPGFLDLE